MLFQDREGFLGILDFTPLILGWSEHARRGRGHHSGLHFRETLGSLEFLLRQFAEKFGSHPPEPHRCPGEAQREVGAGGPQMPVDQMIDNASTGVA